ncbi:hypothetical protein [Mycobacteroides chelonae]|uniref:hypothetical protein n=1 Tax=Mycobacteroides chelonae TaxID=1774 RepID=UPI0018B0EF4B|nr:hypothetical protein [Mycobacteroides chelonae]MBF9519516.1 hypothetical protein [Mycobacteroides chelonae]
MTTPTTSHDAAYTDIAGTAAHFAVSVWTVRRWIKSGILDAVVLPGGMIRIPVAALGTVPEPIHP